MSGKIQSFLMRAFALIVFLSLTCGMVGVRPVLANTLTVSDCFAPSGAPGRLVEVMAAAAPGDTVNFSCSGMITLITTLDFSKDLTLDGSGQSVVLNGGGARRVINIPMFRTVVLNHLTITNGSADKGAGIYNNGILTVTDSILSNNSATEDGGGIYNLATLTVTDTTLSGNRTSDRGYGGGLYTGSNMTLTRVTLSGNYAHGGGGIANLSGLTLTDSTLSNNSADFGGGIYSHNIATLNVTGNTLVNNSATVLGGGIYNLGSATLTNSTLVTNSSDSQGGGVYNSGGLTIANSTFYGNDAPNGGGGIFQDSFGILNFSNTIMTQSPNGADCFLTGSTLGSHDQSLVGNSMGCGPSTGTDPLLGPLANNGGPTQTMALLLGSPAIDMGASCPTYDQRGMARQGAACDIGAYEYQTKAISAFDFTSQGAVGVIGSTTIAVTVPYATDVTTLVPAITHTGTSVSPASGVTQDFTSPVVYTVTAADGTTRAYTVTVTVALNPAKAITAFTIAGQVGDTTINEGAGTIALMLPYATNVTALAPGITHSGASVSPASGAAQNFTNPVNYTVTAEDGSTKVYSVTVSVAPNPAKAITAFTIAGQMGGTTINEGAGTITLVMPYATDLTALAPTITHTGASIDPASGAAQNFTSPVMYTVTAADGTSKAYTVSVTAALNPAKAISAFSIPDQVGTSSINEGAATIAVTMPYMTDVTALVPTLTHTGASVDPASGVAQNFTSPVVYTVTAADGTSKAYTVTVTVALSPAKAISAFSIAGQVGTSTINEGAGTIAVTMPFGTNVSVLAPTITHTGASVNPGSGVAQNFTNPVIYTVTAADGTTKTYRVTVSVDCLNLTVANANDTGAGSLRQAIADTCANGTITFAPGLAGSTIPLASQLTLSKNVTIDGSALASRITLSGGGNVRVLYVTLDVSVTLNGLKISGGNAGATGKGGGIYNYGNLTVNNSVLSGNSAQSGGGIYNDRNLTVTNTTLSGNTAPGFTGGALNNSTSSWMSVSNSTLSGNTAYGAGGISNLGTLIVTNSTLVANSADRYGGGISSDGGSLTVTNSTFSGNSAGYGGGGIFQSNFSTLYYANTILANSLSGADCMSYGGIGSNSHNLVENNYGGTCGAAFLSVDPQLGALADNGGPTWTMALPLGSPAIDAGLSCPTSDQRGLPRQGAVCDIGAYEYQTKAITAFDFTSPAAVGVIAGSNITLAVPVGTDLTALVPSITHTGASINPANGVAQNFTNPVTYTVTAADGATSTYTVWVAFPNQIVSFVVPGQYSDTTIDHSAGTIVLHMPANADVTTLAPAILHLGASVSPASGAAQNFTNPVVYTVTGADSTTKNYTVTVSFECDTAITVTNANNAGAGSLRQAILNACSGGTITFDAGLAGSTIPLTSTLAITKNLTIESSVKITLSGGGTTRVLSVGGTAVVTLNGLTITQGSGDAGAGIYNGATLTIKNSTLVGNNATYPGGGGIYNAGTLTIISSTLTANSTQLSARGGAIFNDNTLTLINATITKNASGFGSGVYQSGGTLNYSNTILADTVSGLDCHVNGGVVGTNSHNLVESNYGGSCGTAYLTSDPKLGVLGDNGGPTQTQALSADSPAIDAGASCPVTDQRGVIRQGAACDIGAYEYAPKEITAFNFSSPAAVGVIAGTNITLAVPTGTDVTALVPTITYTGVSVSPASGAAQNFTNPVLYTVTAADGLTRTYTVSLIFPKAITAFSVPGQVGNTTINEGAGTIVFTLPFGTDVTALVPTITHTGASVSPASGVAQNFTNPVIYTVTATDATTKTYTVTALMGCGYITVVNADNAGAGSLRQAIADACSGGTITFNTGLAGSTIPLTSTLAIVNKNLIIESPVKITLSGGGTIRVLSVGGTSVVTLNGLTITQGFGDAGAGIYNGANLTIKNSTLAGNNATYPGGGAIYNAGTLTISNSTLTGNSTRSDARGGAIFNENTLTLLNATITKNATQFGSGVYQSGGSLNYSNTILADSVAGSDCHVAGGVVNTNSHNLVESNYGGSCGTALSLDPKLGALADNGGPTQTQALGADSPVIDAGDQAVCAAAAVNQLDQRGQPRNDYQCDIGAFELKFADSPTVTKTISGAGSYTFGPAMAKIVVNDTGGCLTGITVQRYNSNHLNATTPMQTGAWWAITPSGCTSGFNVNLTLPTGFTPALDGSDKLCRHVSGMTWDCAYTSSTANSITRDNVTGFSDWAAGNNSSPTAITLQSLTARSGADLSAGILLVAALGLFFCLIYVLRKLL